MTTYRRKDRYRHQLGGKRVRFPTYGEAAAAIEAAWPGVAVDGSTGPERTWIVRGRGHEGLVAHSDPVNWRDDLGPTWVRMYSDTGRHGDPGS